MVIDQNGNRLTRKIRKEPDGTYSALVWFGTNPATNIRRQGGYRTREQAKWADISKLPPGGYIVNDRA